MNFVKRIFTFCHGNMVQPGILSLPTILNNQSQYKTTIEPSRPQFLLISPPLRIRSLVSISPWTKTTRHSLIFTFQVPTHVPCYCWLIPQPSRDSHCLLCCLPTIGILRSHSVHVHKEAMPSAHGPANPHLLTKVWVLLQHSSFHRLRSTVRWRNWFPSYIYRTRHWPCS